MKSSKSKLLFFVLKIQLSLVFTEKRFPSKWLNFMARRTNLSRAPHHVETSFVQLVPAYVKAHRRHNLMLK